MRVLFSTQGTAEFDGCHYYHNGVQSLYKRYLQLGNDITTIITGKESEAPTNIMIDECVKMILLKRINTLTSYIQYYKKNEIVVEQAVKNTDICVVHLPHDIGNNVIKYAKKYNKPYLVIVNACPWDAFWNYGLSGKLIAPFAYFHLKKIVWNAPFVIYVTKDFLERRYPTQGRWVNCSNVDIITGGKEVLEKRLTKIKQNARRYKICTTAAIDVPFKGQEYVIRALGVLLRRGIEFEYHLIGGGDKTRLMDIALYEGVSNNVFFHGALVHNKVIDMLDKMDIYIQPSKQEGLPRALIEAMSRGCLCYGSNIAGIPELLDDSHIFEKGNYEMIANMLEKIKYMDFEEQAKRNFCLTQEYDKRILDERRSNFIMDFRNSIQ